MKGFHVIVLAIVSSIPGIIGLPTPDVDRQMILSKFQTMEKKCLEGRKGKDKQILCLMTMAAEEINNANEFPSERIEYIPNTKSNTLENVPDAYGKEIHGEIRAIRLENKITKSIKTFNEKSKVDSKDLPFVFVYSFYIPCASIANVYYSCAEELAVHARLNEHRFNMLVGYNTPFEHTDLDLAMGYLKQRGIYAIVNIDSGTVVLAIDGAPVDQHIDVLQGMFHECILNNITFCNCDECALNKDGTIRAKIDALVHTCTSRPEIGSERGPITHLGMWLFHSCFKKSGWLKLCSENRPQENYEVGMCFLDIMEKNYRDPSTLMMLGKPKTETIKPYWQAGEISEEWRHMYMWYQPCQSQMIHKLNRTRAPLLFGKPRNTFKSERNRLRDDLFLAMSKAKKGKGPTVSDCTKA